MGRSRSGCWPTLRRTAIRRRHATRAHTLMHLPASSKFGGMVMPPSTTACSSMTPTRTTGSCTCLRPGWEASFPGWPDPNFVATSELRRARCRTAASCVWHTLDTTPHTDEMPRVSRIVAASVGRGARPTHSVGQPILPAGQRVPVGPHSDAPLRLGYLLSQFGRNSRSQAGLNASGPQERLGTHVSREYTKGRAQQRTKGKLSHEFQ